MDEIIKILIWPVIVLIIVIFFIIMFKRPLSEKINDISIEFESAKLKVNMRGGDIIVEKGSIASDSIPHIISPDLIPSSEKFYPATITVDTQKLSEAEIETSRLKAQQRINEDTKKVGYQRGKLYLLKDGSYGVIWEVKAKTKIGIAKIGIK